MMPALKRLIWDAESASIEALAALEQACERRGVAITDEDT